MYGWVIFVYAAIKNSANTFTERIIYILIC